MDTIKTINRINKVKQINPLSAINQIQPITTIQPLGNKMKEVTDTVTSSLSDYNNPLEINSVADALFNTDARKLKYGKAKGTATRALIDYINERAITPIKIPIDIKISNTESTGGNIEKNFPDSNITIKPTEVSIVISLCVCQLL